MLHIKNIINEMASFDVLKSSLSLYYDIDIQTMRSTIFGGKTTKAYYSIWAGVVGFCSFLVLAPHRRYCLSNEVMPTEREAPLATGFYNLQPTL